MANENPVLKALTLMEERLVQTIDDRFRELNVDLDGRFDAVHSRLDHLEQEYEMLKAGMARLEADVAELKADVAELKADVAILKADVAELKITVKRLDEQAEHERQARANLSGQAVEFHRRINDLEARVREIEDRLPRD